MRRCDCACPSANHELCARHLPTATAPEMFLRSDLGSEAAVSKKLHLRTVRPYGILRLPQAEELLVNAQTLANATRRSWRGVDGWGWEGMWMGCTHGRLLYHTSLQQVVGHRGCKNCPS